MTSAPTAQEIAERLTAFVNSRIMSRERPIVADDPFEAAGIDSIALLKVLLFVEAEFGFWVPDEDLIRENVASPRALARYIERRQRAC